MRLAPAAAAEVEDDDAEGFIQEDDEDWRRRSIEFWLRGQRFRQFLMDPNAFAPKARPWIRVPPAVPKPPPAKKMMPLTTKAKAIAKAKLLVTKAAPRKRAP